MTELIATREAFGKTLVEAGKQNNKIIVLSGDLEDATKAEYFKREFPGRFFNMGIAEQDMLGTAAGLSSLGFIPFVCSFASFITTRTYDVLRLSVCFNNKNVKIIGSHGGITVGPDGATAQSLEDLAVTRILPNITVLCPADAIEMEKAVKAASLIKGPVYIRLCRIPSPVITKKEDDFKIGKAGILREGKDAAVIACGYMVSESLKAANILAAEGISVKVINMHTIKPLDEDAVIQSAKKTGAIVTAEDHQISGGLGSAIAETLAKYYPAPVEMVGVKDTFGESGLPEELLKKYHLKDIDIVSAVKKVIKRKKID